MCRHLLGLLALVSFSFASACGGSAPACRTGANCELDGATPCSTESAPVCGADGTTYLNACVARESGTTVASEGACVIASTCGGFVGESCGEGEFCDYGAAERCGSGDQIGACRAIPAACTGEVDPVCGCDDTTYTNACQAAAASVSVDHAGACDCLPPPCAAPPEGCHYEGNTPCACGVLVCDDGQP